MPAHARAKAASCDRLRTHRAAVATKAMKPWWRRTLLSFSRGQAEPRDGREKWDRDLCSRSYRMQRVAPNRPIIRGCSRHLHQSGNKAGCQSRADGGVAPTAAVAGHAPGRAGAAMRHRPLWQRARAVRAMCRSGRFARPGRPRYDARLPGACGHFTLPRRRVALEGPGWPVRLKAMCERHRRAVVALSNYDSDRFLFRLISDIFRGAR